MRIVWLLLQYQIVYIDVCKYDSSCWWWWLWCWMKVGIWRDYIHFWALVLARLEVKWFRKMCNGDPNSFLRWSSLKLNQIKDDSVSQPSLIIIHTTMHVWVIFESYSSHIRVIFDRVSSWVGPSYSCELRLVSYRQNVFRSSALFHRIRTQSHQPETLP